MPSTSDINLIYNDRYLGIGSKKLVNIYESDNNLAS